MSSTHWTDFKTGIHGFTGKPMSSFSSRQRGNMALEAAIDIVKHRGRLLGNTPFEVDTPYGVSLALGIQLRELGYQITKIPKPRANRKS